MYDDDTIFKDIVILSGENKDIKEYFYKDEGLEDVDNIKDDIDNTIDGLNNALDDLNNQLH
jgi:hypothetical protein